METTIIDILKRNDIDISQYRVKELSKTENIEGKVYDNYCAVLYPLNDWPDTVEDLLHYHPTMYILKYLKNYNTYKIYKVSGEKELIAAL